MEIIKKIRLEIAGPRVEFLAFFGGLCFAVLILSLSIKLIGGGGFPRGFFIDVLGAFSLLVLWLIFGWVIMRIGMFLSQYFVPDRFVRQRIEGGIDELKMFITDHPTRSKREREDCEKALREVEQELAEAQRDLDELPNLQAGRLAEYEKELKGLERALADLK